MKYLIISFLLVVNWQLSIAQEISVKCSLPDSIMNVDIMGAAPKFPGGGDSLSLFIKENINYPQSAISDSIAGVVLIAFSIDKKGLINGTRIVKGIRKDVDKEVLRVVKLLPAWQPAEYNGRTFLAYLTIPVRFELSK